MQRSLGRVVLQTIEQFRRRTMRKLVLALTLAAVATPAVPVLADPPRHAKAWGHKKKADRYYADRYYREGRYEPRQLSYNDRIYRGEDGRYYCRRSDGTTGLIIGGIGGGVLGNLIAPGDSKTLGTILGAGAGALIGRAIDRDNVTCR
jgi:hypothetical protein